MLDRPSRAAFHARAGLDEAGEGQVLLSDGFVVYAQYAARTGIAHAQCWSHTRRYFERAKDLTPCTTPWSGARP